MVGNDADGEFGRGTVGVVRREASLLSAFLIPFTPTEALTVAAGVLRGQVRDPALETVPLVLVTIHLVLSTYLGTAKRGARAPAVLLATSSVPYAAF